MWIASAGRVPRDTLSRRHGRRLADKGGHVFNHLAEADRPIVICFDELPVMLSRLLRNASEEGLQDKRKQAELFLSWLRHVMGEHQGQIRYIVCGSIGLEPVLSRYGLSHTVAHLRPFHLDPWDRDTADRCLVAMAANSMVEWPEPVRHALLDRLAYFVPYHVQMYFAHLMDDCCIRKRDCPTVKDVERVYTTHMLSARGHAEMADYEERLLRVLDERMVPLALDLLTEAAVRDGISGDTAKGLTQRHRLTDLSKSLQAVIAVLEHDGYLRWDDGSNTWRFISPLMRDWWKKRFGQSYLPLEGSD